MGYYDGVAKSSFIATIDPDLCDYCGDCFTACNVRAIGLDKNRGWTTLSERVCTVNKNICLGCGACISACEKSAISLIPRENPQIPKGSKRELYKNILKEKNRLTPFVVSRVKKKVKNLSQRIGTKTSY
jgi:MinD superfamily P-loop ATPase